MAKDYTALKKQFLESTKDFEEKLLLAKSSIIRSTIYITDTQDKLTDEATLDTIRNQIITNKKIANINISLDSISLVVSRYSQKVDTIEDVYAREYINNFSKSGQLKRWTSNGATITVDNTKGYALKLTSAGRQEAYSDMFEVSPTNTFKVAFSLNNPNVNNSGTVSFKVYAYDKNKSLVSCKAITSSNITDSTDIELFATKNTTNTTYQTFSGYIYGCNTAVDTNVPKGEMMRAMKLSENVRYLSIRLVLNCVEPYGDGNNHTVYIADPFIGDIDNSVVSINNKLTEAFIKLEPDKIMQVVSNKVYTKEEINNQVTHVENKIDNLNIGTENYILNTNFLNLENTYSSDGTITVNDGTMTVKNATVLKMDLAKAFSTIKASGDITMSAIATQTANSNVGLNKFIGGNIDVYSENHSYIVDSIKKLKINMITIPVAVTIPNATSSNPIVEDWALNRTKAYLDNLDKANLITKDTCLIFEPHPIISGGSISETELNPSNKTEFFNAWKTLIVNCLTALSNYSFYGIYIGTNFEKFDSSEEDLVYWNTLCEDLRALYNNHKLIYRINYWTTASWAQDLKDKYLAKLNNSLWSKVDIISIASYFELNEKRVPTVDELYNDITKGTSIYGRGQNIYQEVKNFYDKWKKPVMFGELGCPSKEFGAKAPWDNLSSNTDSQEVQNNYFEAYNKAFIYENVELDNSWFLGYSVFTIGTPTTEYDIVNKQAQSSINKGIEFIKNNNSLHIRCQINDKATNKTIVDFNLPLSQMMNSVQSATTKLLYDATSTSQIVFNLKPNATFTMSKPILTEGTKASSWTRSSEDIQAEIGKVQNNLDNLSIGVTNLLVNSNFKKGLSYYTIASPNQPGTIEVVDFQGRKCVHFDNVGYWDVSKYLRTPNFAVKQGEKVTFSADIYLTKGAYISVDYAGVLDRGDNHITVPTLNKWYRLSATSTVGATTDGSGSLSLYAWGREHKISGYITLLKVEVGEKATAWSEALEDIQDQFTQTNKTVENYKKQVSELSTSLGKITARVENSEEKITGVEKFTILRQINNFSASGTLDRWSKSGSGTTELVTDQNFPYALALTTSDNVTMLTDLIEVDNTANYKINLDIKTTQGSSGDVKTFNYYFGIYAFNKDRQLVSVRVCNATQWESSSNPYFAWDKILTNDWKTYTGYLYGSTLDESQYNYESLFRNNCDRALKLTKEVRYIQVRFLHFRGSGYGDSKQGTIFYANPTMMKIDDRFLMTEKRLKTAEIQLEEDSITAVVAKKFYTKDDINAKGYQSSSQVQQKVDQLQIKFSESGGYNLLHNTLFANHKHEFWAFVNGGQQWTNFTPQYYPDENGWMVIQSTTAGQFHFGQGIVPIKPNTTYTFSVGLTAEHNVIGARLQLDFTRADGTYIATVQLERWTIPDWNVKNIKRFIITFTTPNNSEIKGAYVYINHLGLKDGTVTYSLLGINKPCLIEGDVLLGWSPHPSEICDGILTATKDGITVRNSEADTYTRINAESFAVNDYNNGTVAEFGRSSLIPNLNCPGALIAGNVFANNLPTKSTADAPFFWTNYYVQGEYGNDNNPGTGWGTTEAFRTIEKALAMIPTVLNQSYRIYVGGSVSGAYVLGRSGSGTLEIHLEDDCVVNSSIDCMGCSCRLDIKGNLSKKGTLKQGIAIRNCTAFDIGWLSFRGANWAVEASCNIFIGDNSFGIIRCNDFNGVTNAVTVSTSTVWCYDNIGSDITNYIGIKAYTNIYMMTWGTDNCPDFSGSMYSDAGHARMYHIFEGANFTKTPSIGWNPSYTPTQRVTVWDFNSIWSDETLNGWSNVNELVQGYYSGWNTGRWTGYMQMSDGMASIRNTIVGGSNLSGRIYVQRRTSSGNSTGSLLCLYASDGTLITNSTRIDRGQGVWVYLSGDIISKIQSGAITYFYLRADGNNSNTYFKCESNAKIEITYTK